MKTSSSVGCIALIACLMAGCTTPPVEQRRSTQCIADPVAWATDYWGREFLKSGKLYEYEMDIDHDGVSELFVAFPALGGLGGCPQLVFNRQKHGYRLLGELLMHPRALRVLPLAEDGSLRIATFERLSGHEGFVVWWTSKNGEFVALREERIYPGDSGTEEGRRRYRELFGE